MIAHTGIRLKARPALRTTESLTALEPGQDSKMNDVLRSILVGTAGLSAGAVIALLLTLTRRSSPAVNEREVRSVLRGAALAIVAQSGHFAEEYATGFHVRFPELLGLAPWPTIFFLTFNLCWLVIWIFSLWGVSKRRHLAFFPLWFLAVAGLANGVAHVGFSLRVGGYFPGLFTSPLIGAAAAILARRLARLTAER